jgi:hypothetical protein
VAKAKRSHQCRIADGAVAAESRPANVHSER